MAACAVNDALGFAKMLAEDEGISDQWNKARDSGDQTFVDLPKQIPVRLLYENVRVTDGGQVAIGTDPYGWNGPVARALGFQEGKASKARADKVDIGP